MGMVIEVYTAWTIRFVINNNIVVIDFYYSRGFIQAATTAIIILVAGFIINDEAPAISILNFCTIYHDIPHLSRRLLQSMQCRFLHRKL